MTTADILTFIATRHCTPLVKFDEGFQNNFPDATMGALVALQPLDHPGRPGALRVYLIDPAQSSIDVIDLHTDTPRNLRVIVSAPQVL